LSADRRSLGLLASRDTVFKNLLLSLMLACCSCSWGAEAFGSAHLVVIDEDTGEVLLQKDAATPAPIASLTKLMTVMVVLDARQDLSEAIRIDEADRDTLKHTRGGVPVGAAVPRDALLELALIASDNHAASALARNYPGGPAAFAEATQRKIGALGLANTTLVEPTGLSPDNHASALDMAKVLQATQAYPLIAQITTRRTHEVLVNGQRWAVRNTNGLVGKPGWEILTSKTGYTSDAGRCLTMRLRAGGRTVSVVLIGALAASARSIDALNIRRWLNGEAPVRVAAQSPQRLRASTRKARAVRVVRANVTGQAAPT
jgi:serine-type D-Ala-D-Ala endopeptidase (penicillin-binding protein 7)